MNTEEMTFWARHGLTIPSRESPIRFAVQKGNGITSNAWGVHVENTGDAYVYCRDNLKGQKISLHRSGKQHISLDESFVSQMGSSDRFMNQWREPHYTQETVATFRLLFPAWGVGLSEEQRRTAKSAWNKNDLFIYGHHEFMTVVSFVIADVGVTIRKKKGSYAMCPIGILPLRPGKTLWVIAGWQPEGNLKTRVEEALGKIDVQEHLPEDIGGDTLSMCLTGESSPDSTYMVVVPVKVKG